MAQFLGRADKRESQAPCRLLAAVIPGVVCLERMFLRKERSGESMAEHISTGDQAAAEQIIDERLFGWNPAPGIVSVWADRSGRALLWRREGERVTCSRDVFRPWLLATSLDDLRHVREAPMPSRAPGAGSAMFTYRELAGQPGSFRYILFARDGRILEQELTIGASKRLGRRVNTINDLPNDYYRVGPVEQYLMLSGRVYFRGLNYEDIHRLQFDLETTALDPQRGRIFLIAVMDNRGFSAVLDAPTQEDEPRLIRELCALIQERDPDVIENHNLFGFDLPFLERRASVLYRDNNVLYHTIKICTTQ